MAFSVGFSGFPFAFASPASAQSGPAPRLRSELLLRERRVARSGGHREVEPADDGTRLLGSEFPIHAGIFPLDRERPLVAHAVQRPDDLLEGHGPRPSDRKPGCQTPNSSRVSRNTLARNAEPLSRKAARNDPARPQGQDEPLEEVDGIVDVADGPQQNLHARSHM